MNLHEIFNNPNPSYSEVSYVYQKSYSMFSTTEELNIILDYSLKSLHTVSAKALIQHIWENPASDEEILLRIKAMFYYYRTLSNPSQ